MSTRNPNPESRTAHLLRFGIATLAMAALLAAPAVADSQGDKDHDKDGYRVIVRNGGNHALNLHDCDEDDDGDCQHMIFVGGSGGFLGVEMTQLSAELRTHFGAPEKAGVMIAEVVEGSPADEAGLAVGDVIVAVDGESVRSAGHLGRLIRHQEDGASVDIEIVRERRSQVVRAHIEHRERSVVDLGDLMGSLESLEHLEHLEGLGPQIGAIVGGTLESLNLEGLGDAFKDLPFGPGVGFTLDEEALEEAMKTLEEAYDSDAWQEWAERLENLDWSSFEARMEELKTRMEELEHKLHEDDQ